MLVQIRQMGLHTWDWLLWDDTTMPWTPLATSCMLFEESRLARACFQRLDPSRKIRTKTLSMKMLEEGRGDQPRGPRLLAMGDD